ncbi:MAG: hypothetical protein AAGC72_08000 [Planctomycetota bacterium]
MRYACFTFGLLLCTAQLGCSTTPAEQPQPARLTFSEDRYPVVYEAAVETLRTNGYRIARSDYRFGTITTFPKEAATSAEFWVDDATTYAQRRSDTYNAQQRTVTVQVEQREADAGFSLSVRVEVQRLQRPERYLTHSAGPQISAAYTDVPMHLKDRGIDGPYAYTIERDPLLERRLLDAIKEAVPDDSSEEAAAQPRSERIETKIALVQSLLTSVSKDPLTKSQRAQNPELVTLDRFQRGHEFTKLFDLLDRLKETHPKDALINDLYQEALIELAAFENQAPMN